MPNILIRDVPPQVHERLQARAAATGQSLQQYLIAEISRLVEKPTIDEWIARVEARLARGGGYTSAPGETAELIRAQREERTAHLMRLWDENRERLDDRR